MPAYNFKDRFVPLIQAGLKTTTIRQRRKQRLTRVGDQLFLFNRMRSNRCRLIKDTECVKLTPIKIHTGPARAVWLDGKRLSFGEQHVLALCDGFGSAMEFFLFFKENYGPGFQGELIEWKP